MIVLDTDVMIDLLRQYPPAVIWLSSLGSVELVLPGYVVMELIQGCRNKTEQEQLIRFLSGYRFAWPAPNACNRAIDDFARYRLSSSIGLLDTLIAHTCIGLGEPLHTFNQKHYASISALTTVQPYQKAP